MAPKHHRPDPALWNRLRPAVQQLRSNPTQAEALLWEQLNERRLHGYKFRRQHAIDRFVVDFYCPKARLAIEVDGPVHQSQTVEDQERQAILEEMGFRVLRFSNDSVLNHMDEVLAQICDCLEV